MAKKTFTSFNPADEFFSLEEEPKEQTKQPIKKKTEKPTKAVSENVVEEKKAEKAETKLQTETIAKAAELLPKREKKSVRLNLLITPTLKDKFVALSEATGYSINDLIGKAMESYLEVNRNE